MPVVYVHILALVILGAQVMVVIQASQILDGGTLYVLQTCQYVTLNREITLFIYNAAFSYKTTSTFFLMLLLFPAIYELSV